MKNHLILFITLLTAALSSLNAQETAKSKPSFGVAIGGSASTNGLGVNVTTSLNNFLAVRLGYEQLDASGINPIALEMEGRSFNITPTIQSGGLSAMLDLYLLKGLYLSGGIVQTNLNISATIASEEGLQIGEIYFEPEELGDLTLTVGPKSRLAPYAGLGFGRTISRDKRLAMSFEMGAYHMGSYVVDMTGTKFFEGNEGNESIQRLNETLSSFSWSGIYPILKLGISFRIL